MCVTSIQSSDSFGGNNLPSFGDDDDGSVRTPSQEDK